MNTGMVLSIVSVVCSAIAVTLVVLQSMGII
jgi:hypothetical protein